ncbi:DUF3703 domain-containing protein [Pseudofulvibacter geojedonensis]|uniref:DUF3703 domain-containing protein n=1 Tax=Pseudofulvibacter geojedonensis TaxID=1123758 RepID=A0ABW3I311_9FLAO
MKFNTTIPENLKLAFEIELKKYRQHLKLGNHKDAWYHLERSHIIGQSYPIEHTYSHWLMLKFGFRQNDIKEVFGQIIRLLVGGWKSFIDHVPLGNTGGADVPPLQKMPIPKDIQNLLEAQ